MSGNGRNSNQESNIHEGNMNHRGNVRPRNSMGKDEQIPMSLINEPRSSRSNDKKRSEEGNFWEPSHSSKRCSYEKEVKLDKLQTLDDFACASLVTNSKFLGLEADVGSWANGPSPIWPLYCDSVYAKAPYMNGEGSLWFPKTLRIDNLEGVSCDGGSILVVGTMAIDLRVVNDDNPWALIVGFSQMIDDQGCVNFGGFLRIIGHYGSRGCFIVSLDTQVLLEEQFSFLARGIKGKGKFSRKWIMNAFVSGSNHQKGKKLVGVVSHEKLLDLLELALSANTARTVRRVRELMDASIEPMDLMSQLAFLIMDILASSYKLAYIKGKGTVFHMHALTKELERLRRVLKFFTKAKSN
eukprot:Gb_01879 [translate_table: standard]